jgi:hypothetical protein
MMLVAAAQPGTRAGSRATLATPQPCTAGMRDADRATWGSPGRGHARLRCVALCWQLAGRGSGQVGLDVVDLPALMLQPDRGLGGVGAGNVLGAQTPHQAANRVHLALSFVAGSVERHRALPRRLLMAGVWVPA